MCKSVLMEVIHRTRTLSDGNLHVLVVRHSNPILDMGLENRSDGIHRIHRTLVVSDGKVDCNPE